MATGSAAHVDSKPRARYWRSVLAALISFALVLSVFHGICADDDSGALTLSAATQVSCDVGGKSVPDSPAPHGDHCLAHVTTVAPQDNAVAIQYVTRVPRLAAMLAPEAADLASPFKPPRA